MPTITIQIPEETLEAIKRQAEAEGIDLEAAATLALMAGVHGEKSALEMILKYASDSKKEISD